LGLSCPVGVTAVIYVDDAHDALCLVDLVPDAVLAATGTPQAANGSRSGAPTR
jgi:hypothetical protein